MWWIKTQSLENSVYLVGLHMYIMCQYLNIPLQYVLHNMPPVRNVQTVRQVGKKLPCPKMKKVLSKCQNAVKQQQANTSVLCSDHTNTAGAIGPSSVHTCWYYTVTWQLHDVGNKILLYAARCTPTRRHTSRRKEHTHTLRWLPQRRSQKRVIFLFTNTAPSSKTQYFGCSWFNYWPSQRNGWFLSDSAESRSSIDGKFKRGHLPASFLVHPADVRYVSITSKYFWLTFSHGLPEAATPNVTIYVSVTHLHSPERSTAVARSFQVNAGTVCQMTSWQLLSTTFLLHRSLTL